MEKIFTPEQANMPVTYGGLMDILTPLMKMVAEENNNITFKSAEIFSDYMVQIRDDADYNRQRDIRFVINLIAQIGNYDKNVLNSEYERWCEEFDKLNKPRSSEEKKDG